MPVEDFGLLGARKMKMDARISHWCAAFVYVFMLLGFGNTTVEAIEPTPEQIKLFQQLSPEQRAQMMSSLQEKQQGTKAPSPLAEPVLVKPREVKTQEASAIEAVAKEGTETTSLQEKAKEKSIQPELKQFGYDLFAGSPTTFAPATDIPIPVDYVIGPGDTIQVQLFGKESLEYELLVNRDGQIQFPGIGPIAVVGLTFDELKRMLTQRIAKQMIGVKASIALGALRSMRVFVMGDVNRPGSYTVSSLSSMTNALFVSGGIQPIGSLRDIQLKRNGKVITHLDLYDLLLKGDTHNDVRIQPGDVIFVPPIGETVGVGGEVRRPAIYEIKGQTTVAQVLELAGGLLPTAYPAETQLARINDQGERTLVDIDLTLDNQRATKVHNGDVLRIYSVLEKMENIVLLSGHVQRPGGLQWTEGMRLTDAIPSVTDLLPEPDVNYVLIRREQGPLRNIVVVTANLGKALAHPHSDADVSLMPRDQVFVFGLNKEALRKKRQVLDKLDDELRQQARFARPEHVVTIKGDVRGPGAYPLAEGMRLQELLAAANDFLPDSDRNYLLVTREHEHGKIIEAFSVEYGQAGGRDLILQPRDSVYVFEQSGDRQELLAPVIARLKSQARYNIPTAVVNIGGLVVSGGQYPLERGMRVADLIRASGGLKESAYELEAEISRYETKDRELRLTRHVKVNLGQVLAGNFDANIALEPHDVLQIKRLPQWTEQRQVELKGEVRFPGVYQVRRDETLHELLLRAGGLTEQAFPQGAIFLREDLKEKEQRQIDTMVTRLESDIASAQLEKSQLKGAEEQKTNSVGLAQSLLAQLKSSKALGRLVIDLPKILAADVKTEKENDILLKNGDQLFVPALTQEVTVIGEVQYSTSHLFEPGLKTQDYIAKSGGLTYRADDNRIYVVRANGSVVPSNSEGWFNGGVDIKQGDTIVVPLDAERMRPLTLWTNVTQIIYQLGIAAASWNAVGVF
jgi:polysaccharide export outer membrane protein